MRRQFLRCINYLEKLFLREGPCLQMTHYLLSVTRKHSISSRFSMNSEAKASELLENLEDILNRHYKHNTFFSRLKYLTTHGVENVELRKEDDV